MKLDLKEHLTSDKRDALLKSSHEGQAHFGGNGPVGSACYECRHWKPAGTAAHEYYSASGLKGGGLKPHPCEIFRRITGSIGPKVPYNAAACRYFERSDNPPPLFDPERRR